VEVKHILSGIPDKSEYKETTSLKFKKDVINFFNKSEFKNKTVLELGTNHGHTARVLSFIFGKVITMDWREEPNLRMAKELNEDRDNIVYIQKDLYKEQWNINEKVDVFFIDCVHDFNNVYSDINNCSKIANDLSYFVFDDYGFGSYYQGGGVKSAVDKFVEMNEGFEIIKHIGHSSGETIREGKPFLDSEGVICKYENKKEVQWWEK
tara:strand:- start:700 stop:1323 length:624 start_codon:yes stop_codon:yes gene_type:complete